MKANTRTTIDFGLQSQIGAIRAVCRQTRRIASQSAKVLNVYQERDMKVEVRTGYYAHTHGRKPKGRGNWVFSINGYHYNYQGLYSEVCKQAKKKAKQMGVTAIVVMP